MAAVKTVNGLALASMKTRNGLAAASVKTILGVDSAAGGGSPFGGLVSTANLVDWWPLNEASGNRAGVHAGLTLTDNNTVGSNTGNGGGTAADFEWDNGAEFLERASEAALQFGNFDWEIVLSLYLESKANPMCPISKYDVALTTQHEVYTDWTTSTDRFRLLVSHDGAAENSVSANTFGAPSTGAWYMLSYRHDSVNDLIGIAVNAGTVDTAAHVSALTPGAAPFRIGSWKHSSQRSWDGRIQRVGFWKRLLTSGERTALYNSGAGLDY
jgi:hypothetical protein